mgnify:CR=1 FL=1
MEGRWLVFYDNEAPYYERHCDLEEYKEREESLKRISEIKKNIPGAKIKLYWSESEEDFS